MPLPFCYVTLRGQKPLPAEFFRELRTLGDHLRRRRLERGLLQTEVAALLGVHTNTVQTWERNEKQPLARHVPRIHEFLGYCLWEPGWTLAARLRRAREALGLGQRELARRLGTSQQVLRGWETGQYRPSRRSAERLGAVVGPIVGPGRR